MTPRVLGRDLYQLTNEPGESLVFPPLPAIALEERNYLKGFRHVRQGFRRVWLTLGPHNLHCGREDYNITIEHILWKKCIKILFRFETGHYLYNS